MCDEVEAIGLWSSRRRGYRIAFIRSLCRPSPSVSRLYAPSWFLPPTQKEAVVADLLYGALALGLFALFGAFVAALRRV